MEVLRDFTKQFAFYTTKRSVGHIGTIDDFITYLEQFPSGEIVGEAYEAESCPIARYLRDMWGRETQVSLCVLRVRETDTALTYASPWWVRQFISHVDGGVSWMSGLAKREVSKETALRIAKHVRDYGVRDV